ncbi:MAG: efflux RND transporter permease subunit, partial [Gammaproteobacteria bacterium]|nr:efflux RND transporter permease subunit [Gammaproteobacteria bacterium]
MNAVVRFFVERGLLVNLVSVLVLALGIYTMFAINREAFPNVNLDMVEVNVAYPGATPEEIEHLVITPIEQEIKSLDGINKMISVAFPGSGRVILELDPRAKKRDRMASDVQLAVDRAVLPKDLPASPSVLEVDGAVFPIIQLAIGAKLSPLELKRLGDKIEDDLLNIKGVARVVVQGDRKAEFRVVV